jgi:lipopolysaccharide export system permease protein
MKTLDRYLALTLFTSFLYALGGLLAIFSVINLMQELEKAGTGGYGVRQALSFVLMTLPTEAYELFPAAALVGGVTGVGILASHREVVAMWSAGLSTRRLVWSVLKAACPLMVAAAAFGEIVAAPLSQRAASRRSVMLSRGEALGTARGIWARDGLRYINVRSLLPDEELKDLYVYEFDNAGHMHTFTHARTATHTHGQWVLDDVVESAITDGGVVTRRSPREVWHKLLSVRDLRVVPLPIEYLSIADLYRSTRSLRARGESARRYEIALWSRTAMPWITGVMMLLAVPFVLITPRSVRVGQRIVVAALLGIGFQMFNQTFSQFGLVYGLPAPLAALLPGASALGAAVFLLRRVE